MSPRKAASQSQAEKKGESLLPEAVAGPEEIRVQQAYGDARERVGVDRDLDAVDLVEIGEDTMELNMGPQHPSTHGVLRLVLNLEGETVRECRPDIGFLHTGFEKSFESHTYQQCIPLTDRMDYLAPPINNLGFSLAAEKLLGVEVPPRGQYIRVIMAGTIPHSYGSCFSALGCLGPSSELRTGTRVPISTQIPKNSRMGA